MKMLSAVILTLGVSAFTFAASALALPDSDMEFPCNSSTDEFCVGADRYEVTITCMNFTASDNSGLDFDGTDWSVLVYEDDPNDLKCEAAGTATLIKTEIKCSDTTRGPNKIKPIKPNKPGKPETGDQSRIEKDHKDHPVHVPQVHAEIRLIEDEEGWCPSS